MSERKHGLPEVCGAELPSTGETVFIVYGEDGYRIVKTIKMTAREYNDKRGYGWGIVNAMMAGAMFGWNSEFVNPNLEIHQKRNPYRD